MFAITVTLAPGHAQAALHFKTVATVNKAIDDLRIAQGTPGCLRVILRDDYSRVLELALKDILAVCHFEIEAQSESAEAAGLLQQQASARLNKKWFADPLFKSLQSMAQLAMGGTMPGGVRQ